MDSQDEAASAQADEDFRRELAARRKDLEREFADKARELKAQHQRRVDALQRDRAEWESYKRQQQKDLADKAEKLRRNTENTETKVRVTTENLQELQQLRGQVAELESAQRHGKKDREALEARTADLERRLKVARRWLAAAVVALAAALAVLALR